MDGIITTLARARGLFKQRAVNLNGNPKASTPPPALCSITSCVKYLVSMREAAEALGCDGVRLRWLLRLSIHRVQMRALTLRIPSLLGMR